MSVNNNSSRTIDGQNTLFCDTIEITEEIILLEATELMLGGQF